MVCEGPEEHLIEESPPMGPAAKGAKEASRDSLMESETGAPLPPRLSGPGLSRLRHLLGPRTKTKRLKKFDKLYGTTPLRWYGTARHALPRSAASGTARYSTAGLGSARDNFVRPGLSLVTLGSGRTRGCDTIRHTSRADRRESRKISRRGVCDSTR